MPNSSSAISTSRQASLEHALLWRKCLLSWQIPSLGFGLTFILGLGFSYSNQNIRSEVQSVGLVVFTVLVAIGSYYTVKAFRSYQRYRTKNYLKYAIAGLLVNLSLIFFVITSVSKIYTLSHPVNTTQLGRASQSNRTPPIYQGSHSSGSPEWKSTHASAAITSGRLRQRRRITPGKADDYRSGAIH